MKIKNYLIASLGISLFFGFSVQPENVSNQESGLNKSFEEQMPFKTGEKLSYILHYGIFNAGVAEITIRPVNKSLFENRKVLNMVGKGRTTGAADLVFRISDHYETFIDAETMQPLKFNPLVQEGRIFETDEDLLVWVTDDKNKIPILAESKILVGSIKMELSDYEGLSHEIAKVKK